MKELLVLLTFLMASQAAFSYGLQGSGFYFPDSQRKQRKVQHASDKKLYVRSVNDLEIYIGSKAKEKVSSFMLDISDALDREDTWTKNTYVLKMIEKCSKEDISRGEFLQCMANGYANPPKITSTSRSESVSSLEKTVESYYETLSSVMRKENRSLRAGLNPEQIIAKCQTLKRYRTRCEATANTFSKFYDALYGKRNLERDFEEFALFALDSFGLSDKKIMMGVNGVRGYKLISWYGQPLKGTSENPITSSMKTAYLREIDTNYSFRAGEWACSTHERNFKSGETTRVTEALEVGQELKAYLSMYPKVKRASYLNLATAVTIKEFYRSYKYQMGALPNNNIILAKNPACKHYEGQLKELTKPSMEQEVNRLENKLRFYSSKEKRESSQQSRYFAEKNFVDIYDLQKQGKKSTAGTLGDDLTKYTFKDLMDAYKDQKECWGQKSYYERVTRSMNKSVDQVWPHCTKFYANAELTQDVIKEAIMAREGQFPLLRMNFDVEKRDKFWAKTFEITDGREFLNKLSTSTYQGLNLYSKSSHTKFLTKLVLPQMRLKGKEMEELISDTCSARFLNNENHTSCPNNGKMCWETLVSFTPLVDYMEEKSSPTFNGFKGCMEATFKKRRRNRTIGFIAGAVACVGGSIITAPVTGPFAPYIAASCGLGLWQGIDVREQTLAFDKTEQTLRCLSAGSICSDEDFNEAVNELWWAVFGKKVGLVGETLGLGMATKFGTRLLKILPHLRLQDLSDLRQLRTVFDIASGFDGVGDDLAKLTAREMDWFAEGLVRTDMEDLVRAGRATASEMETFLRKSDVIEKATRKAMEFADFLEESAPKLAADLPDALKGMKLELLLRSIHRINPLRVPKDTAAKLRYFEDLFGAGEAKAVAQVYDELWTSARHADGLLEILAKAGSSLPADVKDFSKLLDLKKIKLDPDVMMAWERSGANGTFDEFAKDVLSERLSMVYELSKMHSMDGGLSIKVSEWFFGTLQKSGSSLRKSVDNLLTSCR
ncbi:MAG: hypothetical protein HOE90_05205 [Bacteriovoracaceae bacterium]|nr:hypothetical protein [Bacteriovoracaceae bacterium]